MKWKSAIRKCEWVIVPAVLLLASFFSGSYYGGQKVLATIETKRDTVVRVVTKYKDFPRPTETAFSGFVAVPAYKFITDTIMTVESREITVHDTTVVYLPRERKYYAEADGALRIWVSGYDPRLDRWELDERQTTVTQTIAERRSRWSLGVTAGYGAAVAGGAVRMSPYVGVGVSYALMQF